MDIVLIDTDVIVDFFFDRKPFSKYAATILSWCEEKRIVGYITPVICSNTYYLLRQTATHEKVMSKLSQLLSIVDIIQMDGQVVKSALSSNFNDFEDALQHYAAVSHGKINVILTRNTKDFRNSEIGVMTPENYICTKELEKE
jgi:predicted nucleic acid-binding protein